MIRSSVLRRSGALLAALLAAPMMLAAPAQAQAPDRDARLLPPPVAPMVVSPAVPPVAKSQPDHPAYADLYKAMEESVDQSRIIEGTLGALSAQFAAVPEFAQAEKASPGVIEEIVVGLRPVLVAQSERVRLLYRPANIALFSRTFTPEEAATVAAFYRSDLGRKLMGNLSRSYVPQDTLADAGTSGVVSRDAVEADLGRAVDAAVGGMTEEDMIAMGKLAMANPALLKLNRLTGAIKEIRVQMENEALTAEEQKQIESVIMDVMTRRLAK